MDYLYPPIEPYNASSLAVSDGHSIYFEESGNPKGRAIAFLHGGPGSGTNPTQRRFFNPEKFRIILHDQRGSGRSRPHGSLKANTTAHLIADMEALRQSLDISTWSLFGGSWGSTLALAYANAHASSVNAMILYGIFLCRQSELEGLYYPQGLAHHFFPEIFERYIELLPAEERSNPIKGYDKLFHSTDADARRQAIEMWTLLEKRVSALQVDEAALSKEMSDPDYVLSHSLIENHYFLHHGFIDGDALLRELPAKLAEIDVQIIAGRYDLVCPLITAYQLHKALGRSRLTIVPDAGHTWREAGNIAAIRTATDALARRLT